MGRKYIIEIGRLERLYKAFIGAHGKPEITWLSPEVDLTPYTEPDMERVKEEAYGNGYEAAKHECEDFPKQAYTDAIRMEGYQMGLSDAWETVKKLFGFTFDEKATIFKTTSVRDIVRKYSASETIEKMEAYKQEQEEQIQVGDEVIPRETEYDTMIVTRLWKDDYDSDCIDAIGFDGRISSFLVSRVSKTGKHCKIAEVLQKMKEADNG